MRVCSIKDCVNKIHARGCCNKHYLRWLKYGNPLITKRIHEGHGMSGTIEYQSWRNMRNRCYDQKNHAYHRYGGRGITVCNRWRKSFTAFFVDMGERPFPRAEIDRIDNDGNYEPSNCRWIAHIENIRNSSFAKLTTAEVKEIRNRYVFGIFGCKKLAAIYGTSYQNIRLIVKNKSWQINTI